MSSIAISSASSTGAGQVLEHWRRTAKRAGTSGLTIDRGSPDTLSDVIPEIDIWRVANLMVTRYGEEAMLEAAERAHELAADGDGAGTATWLRITAAIGQLANTTPPGLVH
jgi:hypothetical protein